MRIQHLVPIIFCLIASFESVEAQTETNTVEQQYIHDYDGWPKGTNTVTIKLRIHFNTNSGLSTITVLSHESPILTELAREIVGRITIPTPGKSNLMVDEKGKPWGRQRRNLHIHV